MRAVRGEGEVRIIGGAWRSRRIRFTDRPGLRPTPDRVRETLFNWLGQDLEGQSCLDLFAGSGALGFEAASRGAAKVVMVERDAQAWRALEDNRKALDAAAVTVQRDDALEFLGRHDGRYDVVFADPPFAEFGDDGWGRLFAALPKVLKPHAKLYCERAYCERNEALAPGRGWTVLRSGRAGQVSYQLLQFAAVEESKT